MPDQRSNDQNNQKTDSQEVDKQDIADSQHEQHVFKNASHTHDDFDHLQEHFNAGEESTASQTAPSAQAHASNPEHHKQASDAFNDLANAFAVENTASTEPIDKHDDFTSHLEESLPKFASDPVQKGFDPNDFDLSHLDEQSTTSSTTSDSDQAFDVADINTAAKPAAAADLSSNAPFEDETPVYADLSDEDQNEPRPTNQIIALASALLLTIAGGLYWYTSDTEEKSISTERTAAAQNSVAQDAMIQDSATQDSTAPASSQKHLAATDSKQSPTKALANKSSLTPAQSSKTNQSSHNKHASTQATPAKHQPTSPSSQQAIKMVSNTPTIQSSQKAAPAQLTIVHRIDSAATKPIRQDINKPHHDNAAVQLIVAQPLNPAPDSSPASHSTVQPVAQHAIKPSATKPPHPKHLQPKAPHPSAPSQLIIVQPLSLSPDSTNPAALQPVTINAMKTPTPMPTTLAVIQPTTPVQPASRVKKNIPVENWVVLAPVASNKIARQYMARFKAQSLDSAVIRLQGNGKVHHFVQIKGFHNQQAAQQQRDVLLNTLGFSDVQVNQL